MKLTKDAAFLQDYDQAIHCEWLESNGLGGYAGSTVIGCNTRRYHGLLVAAVVPPAERTVLVNKMDESITMSNNRYELGCNNYGDAISPAGHQHLVAFNKDLCPEFIYEAGGVQIKKTIAMVYGENTTLIIYEVLKSIAPFTFELTPLLSFRSYHELVLEETLPGKSIVYSEGVLSIILSENAPEVFIGLKNSHFNPAANWYRHFEYAEEKERGLDHREDLFSPGTFSLTLHEGQQVGIIISTEALREKNALGLFEAEMKRRSTLVAKTKNETVKQLSLAADQFIVRRDEKLKTVIAGYHWFTDWSRDTMISLPGLCLVTGRLNDAKKILLAFAKNASDGMLPNRFQDRGKAPEYNNADGTLWYFIAIHQYLLAGGDKKFVLRELLPVLTSIIDWHYKGTRYHIQVTNDHLLFAGEPGIQLTWMDAKVNDWVVTPRIGKAVEINALWYNALRIYARLLNLSGEKKEANLFRQKAKQTKKQFIKVFWSNELNYLYDVVNDGHNDSSLRPNQLFALGLPFPLVKGRKAKLVLKAVQAHLVTPLGLRSLSPDNAGYSGMYEGNIVQRDGAYHQGTVWSWLTGIYIDVLFKIHGKSAKAEALNTIEQLIQHLNEAGIGSVSEIFDGDAPHLPRGCIAQAWSVAELLRVIHQYDLFSAGSAK